MSWHWEDQGGREAFTSCPTGYHMKDIDDCIVFTSGSEVNHAGSCKRDLNMGSGKSKYK